MINCRRSIQDTLRLAASFRNYEFLTYQHFDCVFNLKILNIFWWSMTKNRNFDALKFGKIWLYHKICSDTFFMESLITGYEFHGFDLYVHMNIKNFPCSLSQNWGVRKTTQCQKPNVPKKLEVYPVVIILLNLSKKKLFSVIVAEHNICQVSDVRLIHLNMPWLSGLRNLIWNCHKRKYDNNFFVNKLLMWMVFFTIRSS